MALGLETTKSVIFCQQVFLGQSFGIMSHFFLALCVRSASRVRVVFIFRE